MASYAFTDYLDRYGEAHPPSMCYREGEDFPTWQKTLKAKMRELIGLETERLVPECTVVASLQEEDHTRHVLEIAVSPFITLPAYLLVPGDLRPGEKRPGVLASHGHGRYGIDNICGIRRPDDGKVHSPPYALEAVRSGYVVIAPCWWGWQDRAGHLDLVNTRDKCNCIQMAASMYGISVLALHILDAQAALDVLCAREEVDSARIGCIGNSYGGRTAMWFSIFDDRITACVSSGSMNTFRERTLKLKSCGIQCPFGLLRYADVPQLYCLIAPRALQLQAGELDGLITPEDRDHIAATVRDAYKRCGAEGLLDYHLHSGGHVISWDAAARFFEQHFAN